MTGPIEGGRAVGAVLTAVVFAGGLGWVSVLLVLGRPVSAFGVPALGSRRARWGWGAWAAGFAVVVLVGMLAGLASQELGLLISVLGMMGFVEVGLVAAGVALRRSATPHLGTPLLGVAGFLLAVVVLGQLDLPSFDAGLDVVALVALSLGLLTSAVVLWRGLRARRKGTASSGRGPQLDAGKVAMLVQPVALALVVGGGIVLDGVACGVTVGLGAALFLLVLYLRARHHSTQRQGSSSTG